MPRGHKVTPFVIVGRRCGKVYKCYDPNAFPRFGRRANQNLIEISCITFVERICSSRTRLIINRQTTRYNIL